MADNKKNQTKKDYQPDEIESYWQKKWEINKVYSPDLDQAKKPFYNLMMFPYPSAEGMHVGNMYAFTGADVYGRFMRMRGFDVFEPIGLDGFGIHSENYAIKIGRHPKEQAKISEANFYRQLRATGNGFDWSRKVETYDPKYYKWTQWLFIQLFKAGLAYRKKAPVNFCPSCKTVLADEQVLQKVKSQSPIQSGTKVKTTTQKLKVEEHIGVCERCETPVEKKELEQWFFAITKYADRLLANIAKLDWSEKVKIAQRQWIGKSEGARIKFQILPINTNTTNKSIDVFTTRPDTLYGATFLVLSPEHPIVAEILKESSLARSHLAKLRKYVQKAKKKIEQERIVGGKENTGVFTGLYAINPLNKEKLPIWIADYVVMQYGTGALFGDAHDERDVEFAKKYGIPLKVTVITADEEKDKRIKNFEECFTGYGTLIDSGEFSGLSSEEAMKKVVETLVKKRSGRTETTYHLRDWLISRQRYWGPPIPMIYCESCAREGRSWFNQSSHSGKRSPEPDGTGRSASRISNGNKRFWTSQNDAWNAAGWFPVPEKDLPVLLPDLKDWKPTGAGKSPLANIESFVNTKCPNCKGPAKRETDVSDTFLDSSWYFLRYLATDRDDIPFPSKGFIPEDQKTQNNQHVRRSENSVRQLTDQKFRQSDSSDSLTSRPSEFSEYSEVLKRGDKWLPVTMYIGGAEHSVLHLLYARFIWEALCDLGYIDFSGGARLRSAWEEPFARFYAHGLLIKEGAKMSKSKGNVVVPDQYIKKYGSDTLRCYLMFLGPFNQGGDFYDTGIEGMYRFLNRVYRLISRGSASVSVNNQRRSASIMHKTIKKVTDDISSLKYNTAIAALMEWYNYLKSKLTKEEAETYLKLLAPFAPHVTEELWQKIESGIMTHNSIHRQPWPKYDSRFLEEDEVTIVAQVNGKVRDTIKSQKSIPDSIGDKSQKYVEQLARESDKVKKHLKGKSVKKVVYVEGKVINFVTE